MRIVTNRRYAKRINVYNYFRYWQQIEKVNDMYIAIKINLIIQDKNNAQLGFYKHVCIS